MKIETPQVWQICESLQGRDKGTLYAVTRADDGFVLVADGDLKKLESPKRKNLKHLRIKPAFVTEFVNFSGGKAKNHEIAFALKSYKNAQSQNKSED